MYRVLMPVDESEERAMTQAKHIVNIPDASDAVEVSVLYVFDDTDSIDPNADQRDATDIQSVQRVTRYFEKHDIESTVVKDEGQPVDAIHFHAEERDPDVIVMGGRKRSPAGKVLFGSVTMSVLRGTDIPVTVTGKPA